MNKKLRFAIIIITALGVIAILGFVVIWFIIQSAQSNNESSVTDCPENYEPCRCQYAYYREYYVECYEVLIKEVLSVFNRTTPVRLESFVFHISAKDASTDSVITIPNDLLKEHQVRDVSLYSPNNSYSLRIEPEAFRSSKNFTERFQLTTSYSTNGYDFDFLTGFDKLSLLAISSWNVHLANWTSFPPLFSLKYLYIHSSTGLNDWETFPTLIRGLETLGLGDQTQNVAMDRILNWTLGHSASTLQSLYLSGNDLSSIPLQIPAFTNLTSANFRNQKNGIPLISSGSIKFSSPVSSFDARNNKIETIEPGSFQGNFGSAYVDLFQNNLTRFEELVFKDILQQMVNATRKGNLQLLGNPFDCEKDPCHLAWLIRDNPHLLTPLYASCSNGTSFQQLNPKAFSVCPTTRTDTQKSNNF